MAEPRRVAEPIREDAGTPTDLASILAATEADPDAAARIRSAATGRLAGRTRILRAEQARIRRWAHLPAMDIGTLRGHALDPDATGLRAWHPLEVEA